MKPLPSAALSLFFLQLAGFKGTIWDAIKGENMAKAIAQLVEHLHAADLGLSPSIP